MRILIHGLNFWPEPVGVGKYTGEMANWLADRGHEIRVITAPPFNPQWQVWPGYTAWKFSKKHVQATRQRMCAAGVNPTSSAEMEVMRCPIWVPRNPTGLKRLAHLLSFALSSWPPTLRQIRWRPDVVLLVEPTLFCAAEVLLLCRWSKAKSWLHVQDFEVDAAFELGDFPYPGVRHWALACERKLLPYFHRVSTISERMIERLAGKGVDAAKCVLFPNWVNVAAIFPAPFPSPLRAELGIREDVIVALYAGSMGKKQGLDLLVDASRQLSNRTDVLFVFSGEGSYRNSLAQQTKDLMNVRLLPVQPAERLNDLLNLADIHLLPQRANAADLVMPSKLTGMFASGRPVVATASSGTQLANAVSGRGLVVPPGDVSAFVSAVVELSTNSDLRAKLGKHARSYATDRLNFDNILNNFESELRALCDESEGAVARGVTPRDLPEFRASDARER